MRVLITGGAGYIGSITAERALLAGHDVVVIDNLWRGHREAVPSRATFHEADARNQAAIAAIVRSTRPDAVLHFAASTLVPESMANPAAYFENNMVGSFHLLEALRQAEVQRIVFSSTAAVYGEPETVPIDEAQLLHPINPYGQSKLMVEQMLAAYQRAYDVRYAALRYFNVAGATAERGEDHDPETHLIPLALRAAAGWHPTFSIFGSDYPTPDGTAIRDYVHVVDLADAHLAALDRLAAGPSLGAINLGTRGGFSVREVVAAVERVTGKTLLIRDEARRAGDPPVLVADNQRAADVLGWTPRRSTLDEMVGSAWTWFRRYPHGYQG